MALPVSIDYETTGLDPYAHEVIEVGAVPLDGSPTFHCRIQPERPELATPEALAINGLDPYETALAADDAADLFVAWIDGREIMPVAHNWAFERMFSYQWLGERLTNQVFGRRARCTWQMALDLGYERTSLTHLCERFQITNTRPHFALPDATAGALLYQVLKWQLQISQLSLRNSLRGRTKTPPSPS